MDDINSKDLSLQGEVLSSEETKKIRIPKFDKILISISLGLLLALIIMLAYLFIRELPTFQFQKSDPPVLNINQNKVIENPTEVKIQEMINNMKEKNKVLLENVEEDKESLE
jgi:hypothetical protein